MNAGLVDFFIFVNCSPLWLENNVKFLKCAQVAHPCDWTERLSPVYNFPMNVVINVPVFKAPDVQAQGGFTFVPQVVERFVMVPEIYIYIYIYICLYIYSGPGNLQKG